MERENAITAIFDTSWIADDEAPSAARRRSGRDATTESHQIASDLVDSVSV